MSAALAENQVPEAAARAENQVSEAVLVLVARAENQVPEAAARAENHPFARFACFPFCLPGIS